MSVYLTSSPEETEVLGERLAATLKPGSVVALYGGLGAGKTCFTRGLARGLAVTDAVTSPTYTIVNTYRGTLPGIGPVDIHHIDAYRLKGADDFVNIGGDELLAGNSVCIVEWPERIAPCLPEDTIPIVIGLKAGDRREIRIAGDVSISRDHGERERV
ncbi:MAG: tRNA (adenosine(37)-N6)-threonylcarbamoyltransferase complex ATPase subunit type 1 TsaE [Spirochaetaceae bacterium]|jgi:tRNA threonylcarbamoyladenosine biosynthesis protein TsaE|nr:tRNA (adenosine(37)-N6)-threonylcarbamoyltransferase complex ATPase subunit type 1 TsaE [Spirochaetaceae bacterium]